VTHEENPTAATVYGRPGCVQCQYTTRLMDKEGIPYSYVDVDQDTTAHAEVKDVQQKHGLSMNLPVVVPNTTPSSPWAGFSPDKTRGLKRD